MDLYESLRLKAKPGEALNPRSIDKVIEKFLTTQQAKSANRYRDINNIIVIHFRSYTEGQKVDWLDGASITGHFDWRRQQSRWGKNTSENTINSEAGEVLRFLRWCKDRKYLREVPSFEKPSRKDVRRLAFNRDDWNRVIRHSSSWIKEHSHPSIKRDRTLCWNYALIVIDTGIRVGEARALR